MTGRQHAMPTDALAVGTHTRTECFTRAYLPDGRIRDSAVQPMGEADLATVATAIAAAFGRSSFPKGTRFERFQRTVTTNVGEWAAVDNAAEAEAAGGPMTDQQPAVLAAPMIRDGYQCMAGRDDCPGHPSATQICVGSARPEQHTNELSALIAEWHATAEDGRSLVEFLGVTEADYAAWVEGRTTGEELLAARRRADLLERMRVSNERARRRAAERRDGAA